MSAQVTEAHIDLVRCVLDAEWWGSNVEKKFAQLIADSEAKAVAEWQDFVHLKGEAIDSLLLECDRLRAEVERLKRDYDYDHKCLHEVRERCELWKQRAERAEAELAAERGKVRMLHSALQNLADEQNGAPLERRREEWQEAMDDALAALASTEDKP